MYALIFPYSSMPGVSRNRVVMYTSVVKSIVERVAPTTTLANKPKLELIRLYLAISTKKGRAQEYVDVNSSKQTFWLIQWYTAVSGSVLLRVIVTKPLAS